MAVNLAKSHSGRPKLRQTLRVLRESPPPQILIFSAAVSFFFFFSPAGLFLPPLGAGFASSSLLRATTFDHDVMPCLGEVTQESRPEPGRSLVGRLALN